MVAKVVVNGHSLPLTAASTQLPDRASRMGPQAVDSLGPTAVGAANPRLDYRVLRGAADRQDHRGRGRRDQRTVCTAVVEHGLRLARQVLHRYDGEVERTHDRLLVVGLDRWHYGVELVYGRSNVLQRLQDVAFGDVERVDVRVRRVR